MSKPKGFGWRFAAAAIAPFGVMYAYLYLSRRPSYRFTTFSDYAGLAIAVLIGAAFIVTSPIRPSSRLLSLLFYIPAITVLLFYFMFFFIAVVFHDGV